LVQPAKSRLAEGKNSVGSFGGGDTVKSDHARELVSNSQVSGDREHGVVSRYNLVFIVKPSETSVLDEADRTEIVRNLFGAEFESTWGLLTAFV
jgi:hypothetical protein